MSFFENTRKPVGLGGRIIGCHDELWAQRNGSVGIAFFAACPGCHGAGLRLRRWSEHRKRC